MKNILTLLLLAFTLTVKSQLPPPCPSNTTPPSDICGATCTYCDFNGIYSTSAGYTAQAPPGFCGSVENEQWLGFIASCDSIVITVLPENCTEGNGVELALFTSCWSPPIVCHPGGLGLANQLISIKAYTIPGQNYFLMVDGYAGDQCDFRVYVDSFTCAQTPRVIGPTSPIIAPDTICANQTIALSTDSLRGAVYYAWETPIGSRQHGYINNGYNVLDSNVVTIDFPNLRSLGDHEFCVTPLNTCDSSNRVCHMMHIRGKYVKACTAYIPDSITYNNTLVPSVQDSSAYYTQNSCDTVIGEYIYYYKSAHNQSVLTQIDSSYLLCDLNNLIVMGDSTNNRERLTYRFRAEKDTFDIRIITTTCNSPNSIWYATLIHDISPISYITSSNWQNRSDTLQLSMRDSANLYGGQFRLDVRASRMTNCTYRIEVDPPTAAQIPPINNTTPINGPSEICGTSVRLTTPKDMDITGYRWSVSPQLRIDSTLTQKTIYDPNINWIDISLAPGINSGVYQVCMTPFNPCHEGNQICKTITFNQNAVNNDIGIVTICSGQTYSVCGQDFSQPGNYTKTCQAASGCDSIVNFTLQITPSLTTNLGTISICPGQTYTVCGQDYTQPGVYSKACQSISGCDSTINFTLQVSTNITNNLGTVNLCTGETFVSCGQIFSSSGTYTSQCTSTNGCDSVVQFTLQYVSPSLTLLSDIHLCQGQLFTVCGQVYTASGNYDIVCQNAAGCDSIIRFAIIATNPIPVVHLGTKQICEGESFEYCGNVFSLPGSYSFECPLPTVGCVPYTVEIETITQSQLDLGTITLCPNDSIEICGQTFTSPGQQSFLCPSSQGCDTMISVNIIPFAYPPNIPATTVNLCGNNDTIDVCGNIHQGVGVYFDTCTSTLNGCTYQYVKQTIVIDAPITVSSGNIVLPSSAIATDGSIEINVTGGIGGPINVLWYNAQGQNVSDQITAVNLPEGSYYAIVQSAGCIVQTDTVLLMHSSSTQQPSVKNQIYLDPNPATETIQLQSNNLNHADRIEFYTTDGRLCYTQQDYFFGQSINIEQLPGGMLFLKIFVPDQSVEVIQLVHQK